MARSRAAHGKGRVQGEAAREALASSRVLFVDAPAEGLLAVADLPEAQGALIFNVASGERRLRDADCRANVLHTIPQALRDYVTARDRTCRFPGCDAPAEHCDIDHAIAYPVGPTHPSNNKAYCRKHHLLKTFWPGWTERQDPDGTVTVTTPSGVAYSTKPLAALLFPNFDPSSAALPTVAAPPPSPARGLAMPKRRRPRVKARAARIRAERALNADRITPAGF